MLRWRRTSRAEAAAAEKAMLALIKTPLTARDVKVGDIKNAYMRTIEVHGAGADADGVPVVLLPGYGAGACFFWR